MGFLLRILRPSRREGRIAYEITAAARQAACEDVDRAKRLGDTQAIHDATVSARAATHALLRLDIEAARGRFAA